MSEKRRRELEALLAADGQGQDGATTSRIGLLCGVGVHELAVSGVGATVLANIGDGDGQHDGDGQRGGGQHDGDGQRGGGQHDGDGQRGGGRRGGGQQTRRGLVHATNEISTGLEDLQLTVGEGPCLDAFTSGGPVLIDDLAEAVERWPAFTAEARRLGAAAVFSFPLQVGVIRLGSLDCYRATPGPLAEAAVTDALILADLATHTIMAELDGHATDDLSWLADPHAEVHQASGMVQVQLGTTTDAALLRLRAHAYTRELTLAEVARQVVARDLRFNVDPDPLS